MKYIGLLNHEHKQAGYFVTQDDDFIYLFHHANGKPRIVNIFDYEFVKVREIRDKANEDIKLTLRWVSG